MTPQIYRGQLGRPSQPEIRDTDLTEAQKNPGQREERRKGGCPSPFLPFLPSLGTHFLGIYESGPHQKTPVRCPVWALPWLKRADLGGGAGSPTTGHTHTCPHPGDGPPVRGAGMCQSPRLLKAVSPACSWGSGLRGSELAFQKPGPDSQWKSSADI